MIGEFTDHDDAFSSKTEYSFPRLSRNSSLTAKYELIALHKVTSREYDQWTGRVCNNIIINSTIDHLCLEIYLNNFAVALQSERHV